MRPFYHCLKLSRFLLLATQLISYMTKSVFLSIINYPFICLLIRHLDGPIWLCLSCCPDRNSKLPSTLLPLYDNENVRRRFLHLENTPEIKFECQEFKQLSNILELHFKLFQVCTIFFSVKLSQ